MRHGTPLPNVLFELLGRLEQDASSVVRSYVHAALECAKRVDVPMSEDLKREKERLEQVAVFSRPPCDERGAW